MKLSHCPSCNQPLSYDRKLYEQQGIIRCQVCNQAFRPKAQKKTAPPPKAPQASQAMSLDDLEMTPDVMQAPSVPPVQTTTQPVVYQAEIIETAPQAQPQYQSGAHPIPQAGGAGDLPPVMSQQVPAAGKNNSVLIAMLVSGGLVVSGLIVAAAIIFTRSPEEKTVTAITPEKTTPENPKELTVVEKLELELNEQQNTLNQKEQLLNELQSRSNDLEKQLKSYLDSAGDQYVQQSGM